MKITCRHGFFIIRDEASWEISAFADRFGLSLVGLDDFFTFQALGDAENYSLPGKKYLGIDATKAFEGPPSEVMRENGITYDYVNDAGILLSAVQTRLVLQSAGPYYVSNGLIVPGSIRDDGQRVTDYSARLDFDTQSIRYTEVICV